MVFSFRDHRLSPKVAWQPDRVAQAAGTGHVTKGNRVRIPLHSSVELLLVVQNYRSGVANFRGCILETAQEDDGPVAQDQFGECHITFSGLVCRTA
jgi:hypothetical protein